MSRRSVGNTSEQLYFHLSACCRSSRASIQSPIQGKWCSPGELRTAPSGKPQEFRKQLKGKIERKIQYLRHAYFAARPFRDLDDINAQFGRWRDEVAHQRPHPDQPDRSVADVWANEKPRLLPLPAHPFETDLVRAVRSGKTPYQPVEEV